MNHEHDEQDTPRWLRLASALKVDPAPETLARVRARLAARGSAPAWLAWLGRPATVAATGALLVASAWTGATLLGSRGAGNGEPLTFAEALLGDDGSLGLGTPRAEGAADADSHAVAP